MGVRIWLSRCIIYPTIFFWLQQKLLLDILFKVQQIEKEDSYREIGYRLYFSIASFFRCHNKAKALSV
jgi:hypothetical protein